ncbi:MAG TPA: hypothetical protein V6C95_14765 [Coleofasciculaceae cyanobacterium]
MSLLLSLSTLCPDTASLRGWRSKAARVEFLYEGLSGSIERPRAEFGNHSINKDSRNFPAVDLQQDERSGRYRRKRAVPT